MNDDFNSRLGIYQSATEDFNNRLSSYSYYPSKGRTYYNENWWDALSSLMQGSHQTSMKSLSDDNRSDEQEIETLEAASQISDDKIQEAIDLKNAYVSLQKEALMNGNSALANHYRQLAIEADSTIKSFTQTREQADAIVKRDKQLFTLYGHNPILEAIGEIFDYTTTGAGIGAVAGSHIPVLGNLAGGALGGISGAIYGIYDHFASGRGNIDRSTYEKPLSEDRNENYANAIKTRQSYKDFRANAIQDEQEDLLYWQTKYPVSDVYRYKEQNEEGSYLYYNLPGIIGSSFSDTKDMNQQMISAYGFNKMASKVLSTPAKWTLRSAAFVSALRNGYQQSLNENHAEATEVSEKKAVAEIEKNQNLKREMLSKAKAVAIRDYGISEKEADELIDPSTALLMYQGGIGGLDPKTLRNGYSYYKAARQLGDIGADTQFERDMVATAGTDLLESAWMALPIGQLASKYKTVGRAIAGGAIGFAAGEASGFGLEGAAGGAILGGVAAQNRFARKLWRNTTVKAQKIADEILPELQKQVIGAKVARAAAAFGTSTLAEAAEEGVQYINSLDAEQMIKIADEELGLRNMPNLIVNDLKKRGEVFNAVLSLTGLTDSPYQNDAEFWSNYKGGFVLGGLMTGAMVSLNEAIGAKKAYNTAKFLQNEILNTALSNRTEAQDAIMKGQAFAKYASNNNADAVLEILNQAKEKNKLRENTPYTDEDFDNLIKQANRIIGSVQYGPYRKRLEELGYTIGSDEANLAIAVDEYYNRRRRNLQQEQLIDGERKKNQILSERQLIEDLDKLSPIQTETSLDDGGDANDGVHKFEVETGDGTTRTIEMTDREYRLQLHQTAAEFVAVAQLLNDVNHITDIIDFAKNNGIAFNKSQIEATKSQLKQKLNDLRRNLQVYTKQKIDDAAELDRQIESVKPNFINQDNGMRLADVYRDTALRDLNSRVYANIIRSIGISTNVEINDEVKTKSKNMVKRFSDNIQKNKDLQEIVDYFINTDFEDRYDGETDIEDVKEPEQGFENMSDEELLTWIDEQKLSQDDLKAFLKNKIEKEEAKAERRWFRPFGSRKHKDLLDKWQTVYDTYFSEDTPLEETENIPAVEDEAVISNEEGETSEVETEATNDPIIMDVETNDNVDEVELVPDDNDGVIDDEGDQEDGQNDDEGDTGTSSEDTGDDGTVGEEPQEDNKNLQEETVNKIKTSGKDAPKKLIDGWYLTSDGRIIPSEHMFFENGTTVSYRLKDLYTKYIQTAAMIRVQISRLIGSKTKSERTKRDNFNKLKAYVAKTINNGNPDVLNPICEALMNNDKNAIKLLIVCRNKRTWGSYVTNQFFRNAAKDIINGMPVQRPIYIESDTFNTFFADVKTRYNALKGRYTFVTNVAPHVTMVQGQEVVAEPDIVAVDKAGNAHIFNVYTTDQAGYEKMQKSAETYDINATVKTRFSQHEQRTWYATVQFNALRDSAGVNVSSMALLPVCVNEYGVTAKVDEKTGDLVYVQSPNAVTRITLGKLIPMIPDDSSLSKYDNNENQLEQLKSLLVNANELAKRKIEIHNQEIDFIRKYRNEHREFSKQFKGTKKLDKRRAFVPEEEPASIAEAYAQLNKCYDIIESVNRYRESHIRAEYEEIQKRMAAALKSPENSKTDLQKEIDEINAMPDETKDTGIAIEVKDGEQVVNNKDFITKGVFKAVLATAQNGAKYVKYVVEYGEKTYDIVLSRQKHRGVKWNNANNEHPLYTRKKQRIDAFLQEHPEVVLTFDIQRSFITYEEKPNDAKPVGLEEKDSIITPTDINNIGVQQNDGKLVDIGFYDSETGVIQTGQSGPTATLASAPEGNWSQNQLFLVIRQKRSEQEAQQKERRSCIPLVRAKFNPKLANFIAQCFKVIAQTNHEGGEDASAKRTLANSMLHLFIGTRLVYDKTKPSHPNIVYIDPATNGDFVYLNGTKYNLHDAESFKKFAEQLQKCEIMPSWNTLNSPLRVLQNSSFKFLYDHFSTSSEPLKVEIDGVDSGLTITKDNLDRDTLVQWMIRNHFFATRFFIKNDVSFSLHNLKLGNKLEEESKDETKKRSEAVGNAPAQKKSNIVPIEEQSIELEEGEEIVGYEDDEDEDDEYSAPLIRVDKNYSKIENLTDIHSAIKLVGEHRKYRRLAKMFEAAMDKMGVPNVQFVVSQEQGAWKVINGVNRQHRARAHRNEDGSWTITFFQGNPDVIKTLAHELVHVFTIGAIEKSSGKYTMAMKAIYSACIDTLSKEDRQLYGLKNPKEFIAEFFANPELQDLLKHRDAISDKVLDAFLTKEEQVNKPKNLYQSFLRWLSSFWRFKILRQNPNTVYYQIYDIMENVFSEAQAVDKTGVIEENEFGDRSSIRSKFENLFDIAKEKLTPGITIENHISGKKYKIENAVSEDQIKEAAVGILSELIIHADITPLGKNIEKFGFSTKDIVKKLQKDKEFSNWFQRTFSYHENPIISELTKVTRLTDEKGEPIFVYKNAIIKRADGSTYKKKVAVGTKVDLAKWGAMTEYMDQAMSELRIETQREAKNRAADQEIEDREDGKQSDAGYYSSEDYEIDPFDRASQEVKWLFSTIPLGPVDSYGFRTFIPFRDVYGKVLYYTQDCRTTQQMKDRFELLSQTGQNKELFTYMYDTFETFIANKWKAQQVDGQKSNPTKNQDGKVFDADSEAMLIKVVRALRQQQNNFEWAVAENQADDKGNKHPHIDIKTTLYQKGIIMSIRDWKDQLSTGLSGVLKYNKKTGKFEFQREENLFYRVYHDLFVGDGSFIDAYNKSKLDTPQNITVDWKYLSEPVLFSEITSDDIKTYLHNALLQFGVDVSQEVIDDWILQIRKNNPTIDNEIDALYVLLSDRNSNHMPVNFFRTLAESIDGITIDTLNNAFNTGFIIELANRQNEYELRTRNLMTVASHNNQYYIVSERNYVNDIAEIINAHDENDQYIQMIKDDAFAQGSVVAEMLADPEKYGLPGIQVSTFVGMKTRNPGDQGRDYFEIELVEDFVAKLELLHEGYMISPTTSDKKSYHTLKGVPLVGMRIGERSNIDCYTADIKKGSVGIIDDRIVDRFIKYFESEKKAVEKAIRAHDNKFYENNPGKKITNYSDANGMYFSSFLALPQRTGDLISINIPGDPKEGLRRANEYFFSRTIGEQRDTMRRILIARFKEDLSKTQELGLIDVDSEGLFTNIGLDHQTILDMAENIIKSKYGKDSRLGGTKDAEYNNTSKACISLAIQQYILDCSIKHMMSMQEYQRLFSGSKSFYKWKSKGAHIVDISEDYTKRRGGDISTGGVNITDIDPIAGMEEMGTYRCIEVLDEKIESTTLNKQTLGDQFVYSELISTAASIINDDKSPMALSAKESALFRNEAKTLSVQDGSDVLREARLAAAEHIIIQRYGQSFLNFLKNNARQNANSYFKDDDPKAKNPINVADGATYITDRMCEKLLREEGKWDDDMKYAFEVLRGEHGADVLSEQGADLYKSIINLIVGTQKYTATGFRKSDDGEGGTLMTPYYNKTALFPIFEQIAYGKMGQVLQAMRDNQVDMIMMTSAVKVGSQGAISFDQLLSSSLHKDHTYVQEMRYLRKQLNTDPSEREESPLGTQTIKIALSNLRMDDTYTNPLTGKTSTGRELFQDIMRCYNILTDIGFEQIMRRFAKLDMNGDVVYDNIVNNGQSQQHHSQPQIDKKALADFLFSELMSRDANDNMLDMCRTVVETETISTDLGDSTIESTNLAAPISAISQSSWIDSILTSLINKTIIDTTAPGVPYVQRSALGMEGYSSTGEGKVLNNGQDLKLINEDGSMDAIISIDFFKDVIPDYTNKTFEQSVEWLRKHKLIGPDAKTFILSYRIPTQAQSSINPLKIVDVIPVVRDTIILPKDFVSLTGSDYDIDKLYLTRLNINMDNIENEDQMFIYSNSLDVNDKKTTLETLKKAFTNKLLSQYLTLLMDKNSHNTKWRSIDKDTQLWQDVYDDLYGRDAEAIESMSQDTLAYQTEVKNNFVVGKIGIGPFALANNNHIYTMLYGITLSDSEDHWLHDLLYEDPILDENGEPLRNPDGSIRTTKGTYNMGTLYRSYDIYGNPILSWLSGGINAHVDIAKDPFVTKLNINKYTYNIAIFMLRAGFGRNALWFLNQPVIKELSRRQNLISGEYLKKTNKNLFDARKEVMEEYKKELLNKIPEEVLNRVVTYKESSLFDAYSRTITIGDFLIPERFKQLKKDIAAEVGSTIGDSLEIDEILDNIYKYEILYKYRDDLVEKDKDKSLTYQMSKYGKFDNEIEAEDVIDGKPVYTVANAAIDPYIQQYISVLLFDKINNDEARTASQFTKYTKIDTKKQGSTIAAQTDFLQGYQEFISKITGDNSSVGGDIWQLFGGNSEGIYGFDTSLTLFDDLTDEGAGFISTLISENNPAGDITDLGYVQYTRNPIQSFIHNKTLKAINAVTAILHHDSVEATYGFQVIWKAVKRDFNKGSLTEDQQKKLRSAILGAIKNRWVIAKMKELGIDPVSLFRDGDGSLSLAHELVKLKSKSISYVDKNGKKRRGTVANKYKDNVLLNLLTDAHTTDEVDQNYNAEILDFIKIHIPFTDDSKGANPYIKAWEQLYNDDITREFAVKLMFYSIITSNDTGGNNLFKYVPFKMLKAYGLFDAERQMIRYMNDPDILFGDINQSISRFQDIIDDIESILVEDYLFSTPYELETIEERSDNLTGEISKVPVQQYIGYGSVFGNKVVKRGRTEAADRIPYIFIPARLTAKGELRRSKTLAEYDSATKSSTPISNTYIRVLNPAVNYESPQKYLTYKKIGELYLDSQTTLPIYKLVDSSMYTLGQYKVYNWGGEMNINSSIVRKTIDKYIGYDDYSIQSLDKFTADIIKTINAQNKSRKEADDAVGFDTAAQPLELLNSFIKKHHIISQSTQDIAQIRDIFLPAYENRLYLEMFKNISNKNKPLILQKFKNALDSHRLEGSESDKVQDMYETLKKYLNELQQDGEVGYTPNGSDPTSYNMHSGGAYGADSDWHDTASKYGVPEQNVNHYYQGKKTPRGNKVITQQEYIEGVNHVEQADQSLHRSENMDSKRWNDSLPLFARNWIQVKNSDAVFAIGQLSYGKVNGGTGWAVQMAIDAGKPVHVFNLSNEQWYVYDKEKRVFVPEETPRLTKNFAGIGTRSIDPDIEEKTKNYRKPVKYVGDAKREAALNAMDNVFRKTFGKPKPQTQQTTTDKAVNIILQNNPEMGKATATGTVQSMSSNNNPEFTSGDRALKDELGGNPLKVVMASEHTDPAFHSKKVCEAIEEDLKKPKAERKYHMLQIMTKHDGLPLLRMLELKIPKSVHFSISSLGGTQYEPGVMKMDDLMDRIEKFIKDGKLKPQTTTIRIDPIIPGVTKMKDVAHIMERAAKMGIKSIKVSIMDSYGYDEESKKRGVMDNMQRLGYNFDLYYNKYQAKATTYYEYGSLKGKVQRKAGEWYWSQDAKPEVMSDLYQKVDELAQKHGVFCTTCGEKPNTSYQFKKLSFAQGCLNATGVASVLGVKKEDVEAATEIGNQRPGKCNCLNCKSDVLAYDDTCNSQCAYCYAKHGSKAAMKYYDESGKLLDNDFTRTEESKKTQRPQQDQQLNPGFNVEEWSKKEGWSEEYFYKKVAPRLHEAWQVEFELLNQQEQESEKHSGPSSYTYNDGTTIATPFELTDEQKQALEKIEEFINDPNARVLTVSGYAGTGKTSVMQIVAEKHKRDANILFTASTNKASGVLGSKVRPKGFASNTLDKAFGFVQGQNAKSDRYNARKTVTYDSGDSMVGYGSIVIIDEASMINKDKYALINKQVEESGAKVIYLGDIAQLPPVGEQVGPVFQNKDNLIQLTQVMRTGDNAILKEATRLREPGNTFSYESEFNSKKEGVGFTKSDDKIRAVIKKFADGLKTNVNFIKVVTGTNDSVEGYNEFVRECLGYNSEVPQVGEILMGYDNWGREYDKRTRKKYWKFINSEEYIITKVGEEYFQDINIGQYGTRRVYCRDITIQSPTGQNVTIPYTPYEKNERSLKAIASYIQIKYIQSKTNPELYKQIMKEIGELKNMFITNRDVNDQRGDTILKKGVDFGYAITTYKSQGSTYNHVIIDQNNIETVPGWDSMTKQRMYYTAVSRATTTATVLSKHTKVEGTPVDMREPVLHKFGMYHVYNGQSRQEITSTTTFDAIVNGERTATTRYESDGHIDEWQEVRQGDIIEFYNSEPWSSAKTVRVKVTVAPHKLDTTQSSNTKKIDVSTKPYTQESVQDKRTAIVFTENLQADIARQKNTPSSRTLTTKVTEGKSGTNQAVVRMSDSNTYNENAFGLIVKLVQQDTDGKWVFDASGNFQDSDSAFSVFKRVNTEMFDRLDQYDCDNIIFPQSAAMGKAALPKRFAEWLAQELYMRYGLFTTVAPNTKYGHGWYGIYIYPQSDKINIKHPSDKYEYSIAMPYTNLSNFATRPFKTKLYNGGLIHDVNSVEHAFQMAKAVFANKHGDMTTQETEALINEMKQATGSKVKWLGGKTAGRIKMSQATKAKWDGGISDLTLAVMMEKSFLADANADARAELLRTGNAEFTHNFENGQPIEDSTRFQNALKSIREKVRQNEQAKNNCK